VKSQSKRLDDRRECHKSIKPEYCLYLYEILTPTGITRVADFYPRTVALRRHFRASLLYTYNGREWIKNSGGRTIPTEKLEGILAPEDLQLIRSFFGGA